MKHKLISDKIEYYLEKLKANRYLIDSDKCVDG